MPVPEAEGDGVEAEAAPVEPATEPEAAEAPLAPEAEVPVEPVEPVVLLAATGEPFTAVDAAALVLNWSYGFASLALMAKTMPDWQCLSYVSRSS